MTTTIEINPKKFNENIERQIEGLDPKNSMVMQSGHFIWIISSNELEHIEVTREVENYLADEIGRENFVASETRDFSEDPYYNED